MTFDKYNSIAENIYEFSNVKVMKAIEKAEH